MDVFDALSEDDVLGEHVLTGFPSLFRSTEGRDESQILISKGSILIKHHDENSRPAKKARHSEIFRESQLQQFKVKAKPFSSTQIQNLQEIPQYSGSGYTESNKPKNEKNSLNF